MSRSLRSRIAITAVAVGLGVSTVGCGKAAEKIAEKATEKAIESEAGGDANVDIGKDGQVKIETEDGSLSINSGEVPDSWPEDIPLPDDLDVASSMSTPDGATVSGMTSVGVDDAMAFYEDALDGWTISGEFNTSGDGASTSSATYERDERVVTISASSNDDGTVLSVSHSEGNG